MRCMAVHPAACPEPSTLSRCPPALPPAHPPPPPRRALSRWFGEREWWDALTQRVMRMDWSWSSPAQDYLEVGGVAFWCWYLL